MGDKLKTLGQVLAETRYPNVPWDVYCERDKERWEDTADAVRQLVEEWHLGGVKRFADRRING